MQPEPQDPESLPLSPPPSPQDPMLAPNETPPQPTEPEPSSTPEVVKAEAERLASAPDTNNKVSKSPSNDHHVSLAIVATVVIVIVLAVLAVYAYKKG